MGFGDFGVRPHGKGGEIGGAVVVWRLDWE